MCLKWPGAAPCWHYLRGKLWAQYPLVFVVIGGNNEVIKLKHYTNGQRWGDIALSKKAMWSRQIGEIVFAQNLFLIYQPEGI